VRALLELPQWIAEDLEEAGVKIDGPVATSIGLMNKHTGRLDRMLVDLLTYSRVGRMQETIQMDLQTCVDQVLEENPLPTNFGLMTDLAHPSITIGERDILTLFAALIGNAVKHHDKSVGRILVASELRDGRALINVSDDGPGIDPAFHARILQAMTTLRPRDEVEGSGMGLAVVSKIAELNGGSVRIGVSPFGRGTCVTVDLPLPN
jgi:signal transduction histidine kinase